MYIAYIQPSTEDEKATYTTTGCGCCSETREITEGSYPMLEDSAVECIEMAVEICKIIGKDFDQLLSENVTKS